MPIEAGGDAQQGAFPTPTWSEKNRRFTIAERQVNILKDNRVSEGFFANIDIEQTHRMRPPC
ncbi:hypothetical protein AGR1B_Lc10247 [Agrobacterium fabacearum S56]|nr:hypothetical protein AGR1B_Lc10247 [Agrobacterium fabacearum S56]